MSFRIIYKTLFEIRILHHYFLDRGDETWDSMSQEDQGLMLGKYDIRRVFDIIPTTGTQAIMSAHHCVHKITPTGILVGIKAVPDEIDPSKFRPFIDLDDNLAFRFRLKLKAPDFINFTAIPLTGNNSTVYIFKNYKTGVSLKFPDLAGTPPIFTGGTEYYPGDMLSDDANNQTKLFTALVKTTNGTAIATDWLTESGGGLPLKYASVSDRYPYVNGLFNYIMKLQDAVPIATFRNSSGEIVTPFTEVLPGDFQTLQVNMSNFPQGFYTAHIESDVPYTDDISFYLIPQGDAPFGLVEIKAASPEADFSLTDGGLLVSPTFDLRFRNRRTHWRYVGKEFNANSVTDDPLPLTSLGFIANVTVKDKDGNDAEHLPNPSVPTIRAEALTVTAEKKYYSEIHIN